MKTIQQTLIAVLLAGSATASFADGFPVTIFGNYNTNANVGNISSTVNGTNARGDINVAGIQGNVDINGSYNSTVQAGNITTNVQGNGASGSINIGGIQSYRQ